MHLPQQDGTAIRLQQDGFLDKVLAPADALAPAERPINQTWSWDRILRSCYIKQADVLQGFYFFPDDFSQEELEENFDFYEPMTVHESSLSPCVHSILAAKLGRIDKAMEMYLRTARLDLDDYNAEAYQGLHITSMAGTLTFIVEGFGASECATTCPNSTGFAIAMARIFLRFGSATGPSRFVLTVKATDKAIQGAPLEVMVDGRTQQA